ncbi:glucosamine-6-phosphate deaminase [Mycoplasmopsis gallinacea]|uniref:glucosamine-6-phosphate deaminase n=1 Tax=Mycoplasmopsis gallinacea TaxID=29556 RepID=UPI001E60F308|nr:glucosamine-6-phosphate deaminase [Mycoplasmopsis gallinacea]
MKNEIKVQIFPTYNQLSEKAAQMFIDQINSKADSRICFATGSSPIETYKNLIKAYQDKKVSFKDVVSFNLDEYVGIEETNKCSYHYFMNENLFNHIDIQKQNINFPNGNGNIAENADEFNKRIDALGGIDFMILGIGTNGHIAFNEPGSQKDQLTREVQLTQSTIESNKIYFDNPNDIPKTAISLGIGNILSAKKIILVASGSSKAQAIHDAVKGPISSDCPASFLQLHNDVTFLIDEEAAKLL